MRRFLILLALFLMPSLSQAVEPATPRPHWSLELKGGQFYPDIDNWNSVYGSNKTSHLAGTIAYKIPRQLELGIEGGYIRDKGQGVAPIHTQLAGGSPVFSGNVTYELFPLQFFALYRAVFTDEQWLVPYAGGGWTRIFYKETIESQPTVKGSVDGYHARGGVQFLLDDLDPRSANNLYLDYGIFHTYFFLEVQYIRAMAETVSGGSVNLGGVSYLGGLLFEF